MLKVILYLNNVQKPIVFTCTEDKKTILNKIDLFLNSNENLELENCDVFIVPDKKDIKCVLITTEKDNV